MADPVKQPEDFMTAKWRPAMGWSYMIICIMDMIVFPVVWSLAQILTKHPITQWDPLTLKGAGLFHMAMGAVLGVAAWSRGQEKIAKIEASDPTPNHPSPAPAPQVNTPAVTATVVQREVVTAQPVTAAEAPAPMPTEQPAAVSSKMAERMARFKK